MVLKDQTASAASFFGRYSDPADGKFDVTAGSGTTKGFLPVPVLITEPAIGYGAGAALLFFHPQKAADKAAADETPLRIIKEQKRATLPPSYSGVVGLGTENGTWAAGGFHFAPWKHDRIRFKFGAIYSSVNLAFYGGGDSPISDKGLDYNLKGWFLFQELLFRFKSSNFFLGPRLVYNNTDSKFDLDIPVEGIDSWEFNVKTIGFGIDATYDSLDNIFTPSSGLKAEISSMYFNVDSEITGSQDYRMTDLKSRFYWPLYPDIILGWRLHGGFGSGDIPFYALPFIDLRGIPAVRYQGKNVMISELETRWNINKRWSLLFFGGVGRTADSLDDFTDSENRWAGGTGLRYLVARLLGLYSGIDIARGPEEWAFYIQVGSAW